MRNIYFTSDSHWGHLNFLSFKDENGERIRKEFSSLEEMDETMIERWNERVRNSDVVYHLGDVGFGGWNKLEAILKRLNGQKRLVMGNHDRYGVSNYSRHFEIKPNGRHFGTDMTGCDVSFMVSHIPLHPESVRNSFSTGRVFNLHGHTHQRKLADSMYLNVCVENTNYAPISLEEVVAELNRRESQ
jgi:calcineurin-like phosphoesterase family protein